MDNSLWDFDNFVSIVQTYQDQTGDDVGAEYLIVDAYDDDYYHFEGDDYPAFEAQQAYDRWAYGY